MNKYASAIETGHFVDGSVCVDCLFGLANGDWPEVGEDWTPEQAETSARTLAQYDATLGHMHSGPFSQCYHNGAECEDDCDCDRAEFSRACCSVCGSNLAGSRHDVILIPRELL